MIADKLLDVAIARVSTVPFALVTQMGEQLEYLAQSGAKLLIVTSRGVELERIKNSNIRIENIEIPRSIKPLKDLVALFQLYRCFKRNHIRIVHSTTPKAGLLCAIAGALAGVPIRLHTFTGQPWVGMKGLVRVVARGSDWLIGRLNTKTYADSNSQREFLVNEGLLQEAKISVIGNGSLAGVDMNRFNASRWTDEESLALRKELGIGEKSRVILFVGRLTKDKGVRELLEAFGSLIENAYDIDLLLVGPQDNERNGGVDLGKLQRVHSIGYTDCPERYMAISDLLCLPSYREGFGTVVIEAAAMGLPAVGTRIYGLTDAIEDGITGVLASPKETLSLTNAFKSLLDQPDQIKIMGQNAKSRCAAYFDSEKVSALLVNEYVSLLNKT